MIFKGISKDFSLMNEDQYNTIGDFWDEMAMLYVLESLQGLGYKWTNGKISYALGLKSGDIKNYNLCIELPDANWITVNGKTNDLKDIYNEIYKSGALKYEIETFSKNGECQIKYYR